MAAIGQIRAGARVQNLVPGETVKVVTATAIGSDALEVVFERQDGGFGSRVLFAADCAALRVVAAGRRWSFAAEGGLFKLALEAGRIRLAYLFDPFLAITTSQVEPLPHQITAVYGEMLQHQPLRFLLADDPGAGKTIMAGLLIKELAIRGDLHRCLIVKAVPGALLVASLPASQIEIGGEGGALALDRLKNTFGRLESSWRPATAEEGFEIVRRRLFEPMTEREAFAARDAVVKAYGDAYREGGAAYPSECGEADYRRRMEAAYPIHPEVFERLNNDWGALDKFQKTRGVLRLMAGVINVLWEQNDQGLTIMPGSLPLDDPRVEVEMTRYLEHRWDAIIATDIDGEKAHAVAVDRENPNLQRFSATRRVARTLFLASAPSVAGRNPGIDDRRVRLGTVQPGEAAGIFGDALRRLADRATYLYVDGSRYWFSVQPTVTRLADDRAAGVEPEAIEAAIVERLERERRAFKPFTGMHVAPADSADVGDEPGVRLVVLGPRHTYAATGESEAKAAAERILKTKGGAPRTCQNTLLFAAPDKRRLGELQDAVRTWLAWRSIVAEAESLDLTPFQQSQAKSKRADWERTVESRLRETWCWAMAPHQPHPLKPELEWDVNRIGGQEGLAASAGKRFEGDEAMLTRMGARRLLQEMDRFDLWEGRDHVNLKKLAGFFAAYLYLPRPRDRRLFEDAVRSAIGQLVPDPFAYAYADAKNCYEGLHVTGAGTVPIVFDDAGVLVKANAAGRQLEQGVISDPGENDVSSTGNGYGGTPLSPLPTQARKRFFGSIDLNPDRLGRDAMSIAEKVLIQLNALSGAHVP